MGVGRQREFDEEVALNAAMKAFWSNGYSGTSLNDLTDAMGINKPSLYAAFGNKEALFIRALEHYVSRHGGPHILELHAVNRSLRSRLTAYLKSIARMVCDPSMPSGCFIAETTSEAGGDCIPVKAAHAVAKINQLTRVTLIEFFRNEGAVVNFTDTKSPEIMADYILTLQYGLAVMARNKARLESLDRVIEYAVAAF